MRDITPDKDGLVDLPPHKWTSDRPKPREPFFGTGLWPAVAWLIGASIMFTVTYLATH